MPLLMLSACGVPLPAEEPARDLPGRWIVVSRPAGVVLERERSPRAEVRLEIRCPEEAPVGSVAEMEVRVVDPEPGVRYRIEVRSATSGVEIMGPSSLSLRGEWGRFKLRRFRGGRGGVVVTACRED